MRIVEQSVTLEWITPDALTVIERAGRTCYKSEAGMTADSGSAFVRMIIERGHHSVLEHASASFRIICDRGVSHEIVRHRLASYSQESTRYCNYDTAGHSNQITVIQPPFQFDNEADGAIMGAHWFEACETAECAYLYLLRTGASPQLARSVLPTCVKTELVMTCNFREWRHFLKLRTSPKAHPQMQVIAGEIADQLVAECGPCFEGVATTEA